MENKGNTQWTPATIREHVDNWSLADDAGLLSYLQNFSENLTNRTKTTLAGVDELFNSLTETNIALANVTNEFMNLHHTQFIENRVYEEDEMVASEVPDIKKTEEKSHSTENIELMKKVMQDGLNILSKHFERVEVPNSDSEDESEGPSIIVRPKEFYMDRPLPYVIGSDDWNSCDHVGLKRGDNSDSTEDEDHLDSDSSSLSLDPIKTPETTSESSLNIFAKENTNSNIIHQDKSEKLSTNQNMFESSSLSSETDAYQKEKVNTKFAEELASKLGNVVQQVLPTDEDVYGRPPPKANNPEKIVRKTYEADLFSDEPPPLDEVDEAPLFGAIPKENKFASSSGLFDDFIEDDDLWGETTPKVSKTKVSEKSDDIRSSNQKTSYIHQDNPGQKKSSISQGLFDDDSDSDDLFASTRIVTKSSSKPYLSKPATTMPLIDDEPPSIESEPTKKKAVGGVPIFGNQNEELSKNIAKILKTPKPVSSDSESDEDEAVESLIPKEKNEISSSILKSNNRENESGFSLFTDTETEDDAKKFKGLFDDEDDDSSFDFLISKSSSNKKIKTSENSDNGDLKKKETTVEVENKGLNASKIVDQKKSENPAPMKTNTLFYDDEPPPLDDESDKKESAKNDTSKLKSTIDLFKEIDDDLFKQDLLRVKEKSDANKSSPAKVDIFSRDIFSAKTSGSLFDEPPEIPDFIEKSAKTSAKSIFSDVKKTEHNESVKIEKETKEIQPQMEKPETVEDIGDTGNNLKNVTKKLFETSSKPISLSSSKENIGKLSHSLNINVAALLPGSVRAKPKKNEDENEENCNKTKSLTSSTPDLNTSPPKLVKSISFDEPVDNVETLQSLTQERARIPIKRRPSSRRARQQAIRASLVDDTHTIDDENSQEREVSKQDEINDVLNGNNDKSDGQKIPDVDAQNDKTEKDDNDLFSNKSEVANDNDSLFSDDIFKDSLFSKSVEPPKANVFESPDQSNKSIDASFASTQSSNVLTSFLDELNTDNDIFSDLKPKEVDKPTKSKSAALSLFDDDDDIDDIFNINKNTKKSLPSDDANESVVKKTNNLNKAVFDDEIDLFGEISAEPTKTSNVGELKTTAREAKTSTAKSLFEDDDDDDDLFKPSKKLNSDLSQKKVAKEKVKVDVKENKSKSIPTVKKTSLFDMDSDDDLFGSSSGAPKSSTKTSHKSDTPSGKSVKKPSSKVVYDDPLMFTDD